MFVVNQDGLSVILLIVLSNNELSEIDNVLSTFELAGVKSKLQVFVVLFVKLLIVPFTTVMSLEVILSEESDVAVMSIAILVNSV